MDRKSQSLLLYLETCAVDYGGKVDERLINDDERKLIKQWVDDQLIEYGRIASDYITDDKRTHWVKLSPRGWELAHKYRIERFKRIEGNRKWKKTTEV